MRPQLSRLFEKPVYRRFPKLKCHGCGKCFRPVRSFDMIRLFWPKHGRPRRVNISIRRALVRRFH